MDDEFQQLEAELKRQQPLPLSPAFTARVGRELAPTRTSGLRWWWAFALPVGVAATVLTLLWLEPKSPRGGVREVPHPALSPLAQRPATDTLKPVAIENVLYSARDEGLVRLTDGTPARRQRLHYIDTITWQNQATNASLTWTVSREEVRVVRVIYQ